MSFFLFQGESVVLSLQLSVLRTPPLWGREAKKKMHRRVHLFNYNKGVFCYFTTTLVALPSTTLT